MSEDRSLGQWQGLLRHTQYCQVQLKKKKKVLPFPVDGTGSAVNFCLDFPGGALVKNPSADAGDTGVLGLIPGSGRCPGVGNGTPLQYSCLENPMDRGAWQTAVHGVTKSQT